MSTFDVVIIEDDVKIAKIQSRFIEKIDNFRVLGTAQNLEEASDMIEVLEPHLVLLDVTLPDGSGLDLIWKFRAQNQSIDIILITASKEVETLKAAIRGGVIDYILKPVNFQRFQQTMLRYQEYRHNLEKLTHLDQEDVDQWIHMSYLDRTTKDDLPKGIDQVTLQKVLSVVEEAEGKGLSAEAVGQKMKTSRTTARRYLEFLVTNGVMKTDLLYQGVGRPERLYFRV